MDGEIEHQLRALPGVKEDELRELGPCAICGKPLLEQGVPIFYRVTVSQCAFDPGAIRRRLGLSMAMGSGSAGDTLARVMGPDEDLAKVMAGPQTRAVCGLCAEKVPHLMVLIPEGDG